MNIQTIAEKIRNKCEVFANSEEAQGYDFYNDDDLGCMCAIASFVLARELKKNGISCKVVCGRFEGNDHCWVETDTKIIDITATQFIGSYPKVHIVSINNKKYTDGKIVDYRHFRTWGYGQQPSSKITHEILKVA